MHDAYTIGIPVLVILIANLINRSDMKDLRSDVNARFDRLESKMGSHIEKLETKMDFRFDGIQRDLHEFFRALGHAEGRINTIEKRS